MKTSRLFVVIFFISALSGTLHAGQIDGNEDEGTEPEPECDHRFVQEHIVVDCGY